MISMDCSKSLIRDTGAPDKGSKPDKPFRQIFALGFPCDRVFQPIVEGETRPGELCVYNSLLSLDKSFFETLSE